MMPFNAAPLSLGPFPPGNRRLHKRRERGAKPAFDSGAPTTTFRRLLILQIADIGDLILTTPALRALRETFPEAQIDVLGTPHALPILDGTGLIDQAIVFDRFAAQGGRALLKPSNLRALWQMMRRLRANRYDGV